MCAWLFKALYKKCRDGLEKGINDIKNSIEELEERKLTTERHLENLRREMEEVTQSIEKAVQEAEDEAKRITEQSAILISNAIEQKQDEYKREIEKIRTGLYSELQRRVSELIIKEIGHKLQDAKIDRNFQNIGIDNAITKLEILSERHGK
jgi:F0F1-type ATP synthase membrane subunit b/b'